MTFFSIVSPCFENIIIDRKRYVFHFILPTHILCVHLRCVKYFACPSEIEIGSLMKLLDAAEYNLNEKVTADFA
ncbi:hypothetical protein ES703_115032 [subsurface metagenome]